jgi:hypothetical protein
MDRKNDKLYDIRMKYERAGVFGASELNAEIEAYLKDAKMTPVKFDIIGGIYSHIAENVEREQYKRYTREEWKALERQYVHCAEFTLPDLIDCLLTMLEKGKITREQLGEKREQFKGCEHRFCLNYFKSRRKDQRFCCEDCRKREHDAVSEFERTSKIYAAGTYLPPSAYKETRQAEKDKGYRKHERIFEPNKVVLIGDNEQNKALERANGNGKRNRKNEERRLKRWRLDEEVKSYEKIVGMPSKSVQETALNVGKGTEVR